MNITIDLVAPLVHGAFDAGNIGNATPIRRLPIVSIPGAPQVPCLSGNAIRGVLRRISMRAMFDACNLSRDDFQPNVWDRLYAAMANGGHLDGSESSVDPPKIRQIRAACPPLSVFGSALYSWMLPGRMRVNWAWPVCAETIEAGLVLPQPNHPVLSAEELVCETSTVRHVDRTEQNPEVSGVTPMPTTHETLAAGTRLCTGVVFTGEATALEQSVVAYAIDRMQYLGAKSAAGFGEVRIIHDGDGSLYETWLKKSPPKKFLLEFGPTLTKAKKIRKKK